MPGQQICLVEPKYPFHTQKETHMRLIKTTVLVVSLAALAGCGNVEKTATKLDLSPICPKTQGWQPWPDDRCNPPEASRNMAAGIEADLAAARQRNVELERQLADRDKELASLRGELSTEM